MPLLVFNLNDGCEFTIELTQERMGIGREPDNAIVVKNTYISSYHAEFIRRSDGSFELRDLDSRNGVFVNGNRIEISVLRDLDKIEFGQLRGRYYQQLPLSIIEEDAPTAKGANPEESFDRMQARTPKVIPSKCFDPVRIAKELLFHRHIFSGFARYGKRGSQEDTMMDPSFIRRYTKGLLRTLDRHHLSTKGLKSAIGLLEDAEDKYEEAVYHRALEAVKMEVNAAEAAISIKLNRRKELDGLGRCSRTGSKEFSDVGTRLNPGSNFGRRQGEHSEGSLSEIQNGTFSSAPSNRPSATRNSADNSNILSRDVEINGSLKFSVPLIIDGKFEGQIISDGDLTVGEHAECSAEIKTRSLAVYGKVKGDITVSDRCILKTGGIIEGDIAAGTLAIEEGASFQGVSSVGKRPVELSPTGSRLPAGPIAVIGDGNPQSGRG